MKTVNKGFVLQEKWACLEIRPVNRVDQRIKARKN
jgi:hypothetical protein